MVMLAAVLLCLLSCGQEAGPPVPETGTGKRPVIGLVLSPNGLGDMSYNDMQYNGLIEAYRRHDIEVRFRVPQIDTPAAITALCTDLIRTEGCTLLMAGEGVRMTPIFEKLALQHPRVMFALLGYQGKPIPNLVSSRFAQYEGSFVTGVLAARMAGQGGIAFIGGVNIPAIAEFSGGFVDGVRHARPGTAVTVRHISLYPDFSGFDNPQAGYSLARELYASGVNVIYGAAGASGNGIIQAAKESGKYVIGVDSNQDHMAPGNVLTSMMKRLDIAVVTIVERFLQGRLEGGAALIDFGYQNGGVSTTDMAFVREKVSAPVLSEIRAIESAFAAQHR